MTIDQIRAQFPGLSQDRIFADNAAGSQVVGSCIESIRSYMSETNVQLGFDYTISKQATSRVDKALEATARYMNASTDEIVFGYSTAQIVRAVSIALKFCPGDEIVLSKLDHESHISPWVQVAKWKGLKVRWWVPSRYTSTNPKLEADDLIAQGLVNADTRIVCFTHTSNVLGSITDVAAVSRAIKSINPNTLVSVDGVAYAPHAPIDVQAFGVDFYYFSWYKVYGPHIATGFVTKSALQHLEYLGHYFLPKTSAQYILGLTSGSYEAIQSVSAVIEYVNSVGWGWIEKQETNLQERLLSFIRSHPDIQLYGDPRSDRAVRMPVISFRVSDRSCADVVRELYAKSKCRPTADNYWARRLLEDVLRVDVDDGVIRCSFVHYNTVDEVQSLVHALEQILSTKAKL
ncbi:Aminotransferase [Aspergillus sclerotialis]|uniref:Aminotransferase n=1 Tax=Aspergillus sclerotialis TaxID=2070753 RepID=A0A3A2ZV55_9EURO|nr:Aminotransferase [Aspergillus sclerotialis]